MRNKCRTKPHTDHYSTKPENSKKSHKQHKTQTKIHKHPTQLYLNSISLSYLVDNNIEGLIPTRKQNHRKNQELNPNPYHKDHFIYNPENDTFKCT